MSVVSMKSLLESGVHFGHQTKRWNPKMARFIFSERNGIHIIDLQKTSACIVEAYDAVRSQVKQGKTILFIGTKKQAQQTIESEAKRCGMPYVNNRWLGGMLTNFTTIKKSINRLKKLEKEEIDGTFDSYTKKEIALHLKEKSKLEKNLGGIKDMKDLPGAIFIIDTKKEAIAVAEAKRLGIPRDRRGRHQLRSTNIDYPFRATTTRSARSASSSRSSPTRCLTPTRKWASRSSRPFPRSRRRRLPLPPPRKRRKSCSQPMTNIPIFTKFEHVAKEVKNEEERVSKVKAVKVTREASKSTKRSCTRTDEH